jgi:hypothetical protein
MRIGCFVVLLMLAAPGWTTAQGLGDAAAKERQKRREQKPPPPAKVFTDSDLAKNKPPADAAAPEDEAKAGDAAPSPGATTPAAGPAPDPAMDELDRERAERKLQEAEWRMRFANAREQVALAEAACWHEVVRTEYYQGIPVQMKVKEFVESEELRQAKRALSDLEEEFRRTGLPPGWTR